MLRCTETLGEALACERRGAAASAKRTGDEDTMWRCGEAEENRGLALGGEEEADEDWAEEDPGGQTRDDDCLASRWSETAGDESEGNALGRSSCVVLLGLADCESLDMVGTAGEDFERHDAPTSVVLVREGEGDTRESEGEEVFALRRATMSATRFEAALDGGAAHVAAGELATGVLSSNVLVLGGVSLPASFWGVLSCCGVPNDLVGEASAATGLLTGETLLSRACAVRSDDGCWL